MEEEKLRVKQLKKEENLKVSLYRKEMRVYLMTSRFNTKTREQNDIYRTNHWQNGCIYCSPEPISQKIPLNSKMVVLEMDNDTNKIFGVGMIMNKPYNKCSVYEEQNYNRYNYIGKYRIKREEFNEKEEAVFKALDILCFTGNEHMKRGQGIRMFPLKMLLRCKDIVDIPDFIDKMFVSRFSKNG
jgi:hypothetical protein